MRKIAFGFAALAALAASPALAGTATNNMPVSVNVINSCTVAASPMNFGGVTSIGGGVAINTTSSIALTCTNGATYDVALDNGTHAVSGQRNLANAGGTTIPYNVFTDAARTAPWGATSGSTVAGTAGATGLVSLTAYGQIPGSAPSVTAGTYTDTVTVTVTF